MTGNDTVQALAKELGAAILDRPFNLGAIREAIQQATAVAAARRSDAANISTIGPRRSCGSA